MRVAHDIMPGTNVERAADVVVDGEADVQVELEEP